MRFDKFKGIERWRGSSHGQARAPVVNKTRVPDENPSPLHFVHRPPQLIVPIPHLLSTDAASVNQYWQSMPGHALRKDAHVNKTQLRPQPISQDFMSKPGSFPGSISPDRHYTALYNALTQVSEISQFLLTSNPNHHFWLGSRNQYTW